MKSFRLTLIALTMSILVACGQGSSTSSSDTRAKTSNFVGTQTIVLDNEGNKIELWEPIDSFFYNSMTKTTK